MDLVKCDQLRDPSPLISTPTLFDCESKVRSEVGDTSKPLWTVYRGIMYKYITCSKTWKKTMFCFKIKIDTTSYKVSLVVVAEKDGYSLMISPILNLIIMYIVVRVSLSHTHTYTIINSIHSNTCGQETKENDWSLDALRFFSCFSPFCQNSSVFHVERSFAWEYQTWIVDSENNKSVTLTSIWCT